MATEDLRGFGFICCLTGHDRTSLPSILEAVQKLPCMQGLSCDGNIVCLGQQDHCDAGVPVKSPSQVLVAVYRSHKLAGSANQTVLSAESQMVVVQLCLAEYSKQKYNVYDTDTSEVLHMSRELIKDKLASHHVGGSSSVVSEDSGDVSGNSSLLQSIRRLYEAFLASCNMVDLADVYRDVKALFEKDEDSLKSFRRRQRLLVLQWPSEPLERKILELLCGQENVTKIRVEMHPESVGGSPKEEFKLTIQGKDSETVRDVSESKTCSVFSPKTPKSPVSSTEALVHQIFLSYLNLLVNSRDEISLARCLSYSPSGLDHGGFTALKNVAKTKNMSMYQTAVSYITRLRLGGKSYAPNTETFSLSDHVKSLSEFVTNVQKLHMLVEEVPDTRESITKVLLSIKGILCKCRDSVFKQGVVEKVCGKLRHKFDVLLNSYDKKTEASPPKTANQGGGILGRKTLKAILTFLDEEAARPGSHHTIHALSDYTLTQKTPVRIPSLLAQFRSPEIVDPESPENQALKDRLTAPTEEVKQPKIFSYKSDMAWAEPTRQNPLQERHPNEDHNVSHHTSNQPFKLWAETPPERHRQARTFIHEFTSPLTSPLCKQTAGIRPLGDAIGHTPKRPKGHARRITDAAGDKENLPVNHVPSDGGKTKGAECKKKGVEVKRRVKRVLMEDEGCSQPSKKTKKGAAAGQKKKPVALVKGQKTLNQFFRM